MIPRSVLDVSPDVHAMLEVMGHVWSLVSAVQNDPARASRVQPLTPLVEAVALLANQRSKLPLASYPKMPVLCDALDLVLRSAVTSVCLDPKVRCPLPLTLATH